MSDSNMRLASMWPHPPEAQCELHEAHGYLWVVHQDLIDAGYTHLEDFGIVRVNEVFYELQGHTKAAYRILGEHHPAGIWWVEHVEESAEEA